jgi:hypothetical protein
MGFPHSKTLARHAEQTDFRQIFEKLLKQLI